MESGAHGPVAGVILAAGASARMGADKLLAEVGGEPLLRRCARAALAAGLEPVVVVLPPGGARAAALAGLTCRPVVNPEPARGQGSSLAVGLSALPPAVGAAVVGAAIVLLPDMPRVTAAMISSLAARWRETGAPLVVSEYGGTPAPPVLYARALFAELSAAQGEAPGRAVLRRHRAEAVAVALPPAALRDVDTPEELAAAREEER